VTELKRQRIAIAIHALGGQGGGVLADWIQDLATRNGWRAQGTSVPGVAQRTGATVYYIELFPEVSEQPPVLALMPVPGDVDIVIAAELMEAGRAILRGFVSKERTILIASLHRMYAIAEKSAMGDGIASSTRILAAARERANKLVAFDMDTVAQKSGSAISAVLLGALAGSMALPFQRRSFEDVIKQSGLAVESNLRGFDGGYAASLAPYTEPHAAQLPATPVASSPAGRALEQRIRLELPPAAQALAIHGVKRLMDYQDAAYAGQYLDRLAKIAVLDQGHDNYALTAECARYLALWMSYEDTIRVADLKVRATRFERVRDEVGAEQDQILQLTEFMHPRLREICDTLPVKLGEYILRSGWISRPLARRFDRGRHVKTSGIFWFLMLYAVSGLRRWRRGTLRFRDEQQRIETWLALVADTARTDNASARELVECQRLIKGYGDTFDRGLKNFQAITAKFETLGRQPGAAPVIRRLREAALADDKGDALTAALGQLGNTAVASISIK
jgi:indolepyruvate ferredoxin oxidoreductase beta subunit